MSNSAGLKKLWDNPSFRFVFLFTVFFVLFYYFNIFFMGITAPGNYYSPFLDEHLNYIRALRTFLIWASALILKSLNYTIYTSEYTLHAYGIGGINVVYSCLGFGVMSFFTAFIIAWPGKSFQNKIIFLIGGIIGIQVLNIARFILITLFWRSSSLPFKLDHHTLFNWVLYIILLGSIFIWTNTYQNQRKSLN
ncbi:exosortase Y [Daejeonella oryzae]|uniref:exosortase Y n=1 Tax=Daejeonella oryzae TaxID=1122943 RepID=UPI0003FD59FC|nr:archaeosortase/exosortase family protein [Daejeonella oryzae]